MYLPNRLKCAYVFPAVNRLTPEGLVAAFEPVTINPGAYVELDKEHYEAALKGNVAMAALLGERKLIPTENPPSGDDVLLLDAVTLTPPPQLADPVSDGNERTVERKGKVEGVEVDLSAPKRAKKG